MSRERAGQSAAVGDVITACTTVTSYAVNDSSPASINKAPVEQLYINFCSMNSLQHLGPGDVVMERWVLLYGKGIGGVTVPDCTVD
jgi:hypothetical protein